MRLTPFASTYGSRTSVSTERIETDVSSFCIWPMGQTLLQVNARAIADNAPDTFVQRCDELVTGLHGESAVVLTVKTPDCVPVFLFDRSTLASGLVHCGWRGLRDGVLPATLRIMFESYSCRASQILVHIGPFICAEHYPVGPEVAELFPVAIERREGATYLDMGRIVSDQACAAGIPKENISEASVCTWERDDLCYSYRRDWRMWSNALVSIGTYLR